MASKLEKLSKLLGSKDFDKEEDLSTPEKKLLKLESILKMIDGSLSNEDFTKAFKVLAEAVKKNDERLNKKVEDSMSKFLNLLEGVIAKENKIQEKEVRKFTKDVDEKTGKMNEMVTSSEVLKNKVTEALANLSQFTDGEDGRDGVRGSDGKDADEESMISIVVSRIKREIRLDSLNGSEEMITEIVRKNTPRGTIGGGVTDMRIRQAFKNILLTQSPVGTIDGANKTYTVDQAIFAVMAFSLNGEVITQLPNYTIAGKTITFSTALPAVYSGRDFEIKYIG